MLVSLVSCEVILKKDWKVWVDIPLSRSLGPGIYSGFDSGGLWTSGANVMRLGLSVLTRCNDLSCPVMDGGDFLAGSVTVGRSSKSESESAAWMLGSSASWASGLRRIGAILPVRVSLLGWPRVHGITAETYRGS